MRPLVPLLLLVLTGCEQPQAHTLSADDIERIDGRLLFAEPGSDSASSADPAVIRAVLEALAPVADPPTPHPCIDAGQIVVVRRSGRPIHLSFVPGHDPRYYEYHDEERSYRVDHERFVAAVRKLGLTQVPVQCGVGPSK